MVSVTVQTLCISDSFVLLVMYVHIYVPADCAVLELNDDAEDDDDDDDDDGTC